MSMVVSGVVQAEDLSTGWLETVEMVAAASKKKMFHTVTSIANPQQEIKTIRAAAAGTLAHHGHPAIDTVAGTIFPAEVAAQCQNSEELAARYKVLYPTLKRFPGNHLGTYFGRIVAHPDADTPLDQLSILIRKLRQESTKRTAPLSARYEVSVASLEDHAVMIRSPRRDTSPMGFPCLSMCSFQLEGRTRLHLMAHYRSQLLIEKAYGNYVGLAALQRYIAHEAGLEPGVLTIAAGRIHVDAGLKVLRQRLAAS